MSGKSLILCKSIHHQNTARVAGAMADVLGCDVACPEDVPYALLSECAIVGFGSGVYYGRLHKALSDWLQGLPGFEPPGKAAFVFSTSGLPFLSSVWHAPVKKLLGLKGFDVVGEFSCRGFDSWGPLWFAGGLNRKHPDASDLEHARAFARRLVT